MSGGRQLLDLGDRVDGFVIEEVLGVGATSATYRARQGLLDRPVMLKVFHEHALAADPELRRAAEGEAARAARLEHPGIAAVYDMGSVGDAVYVATALVDAEPLPDVVAAGAVTPARCAELVTAIADALEAAHELSVVHREVRPEAISVRRWGGPIVRDFGIARVSGRTGLATRMELTETLRYVAPELILGREATEAADVYGLAATAVFCLTGSHPYPDLPPADLLAERASAPPPQLTPPAAALGACIDAAMSSDPGARPPDCAAFAKRFAEAIAELPEELRESPSPFSIVAQPRRRIRHAGEETRVDRRREPASAPAPPPRRNRRQLWIAAALGTCAALLMFGIGHATAPGPAEPLRVGGVEVDVAPLWETSDSPPPLAPRLPGAVGLSGERGEASVAPLPPAGAGQSPNAGLPAAVARQLPGEPLPVVAAGRLLLRYRGGGDSFLLARGSAGGVLVSCSPAGAEAGCAAVAASARRGGSGPVAPAPPEPGSVEAAAEAMRQLESRRGIAEGELQGDATMQAGAMVRMAGAYREAAEALSREGHPALVAVVDALEGAADAYEDLGNELDRGTPAVATMREEAEAADRQLRRRVRDLRYWGFPVDG